MNDSIENEIQNEEFEQRRKADATALAELLYDIYKEKKHKERLQNKEPTENDSTD